MLPFFGGNHVICATLFFKVNAIILKIGSADLEYNVMWMLHDIESFERCIYGEVSPCPWQCIFLFLGSVYLDWRSHCRLCKTLEVYGGAHCIWFVLCQGDSIVMNQLFKGIIWLKFLNAFWNWIPFICW